MKLLLLAMAISTSTFAQTCPDISGSYQFDGFGTADCKLRNPDKMELTPLPLENVIEPGSEIKIEQIGCEKLKLTFRDRRYANTRDVDRVTMVDLTAASFINDSILMEKKDKGTTCYFGSCLSSQDTTRWNFALNENDDLLFSFQHKSIGLYNYVIPVVDAVKASCVLKRN